MINTSQESQCIQRPAIQKTHRVESREEIEPAEEANDCLECVYTERDCLEDHESRVCQVDGVGEHLLGGGWDVGHSADGVAAELQTHINICHGLSQMQQVSCPVAHLCETNILECGKSQYVIGNDEHP
ncbi:hypothetical protein FGO68_gene7738 [Halteria grandinella]|uniref:Uncharacterized protein n=1 Tax=Halteria grandinella TaxID=5974 RepID=A0A8J8NHT1_HALGN|nr:hypothetical protein FGO68_gene7738 [Halteria grandinella]